MFQNAARSMMTFSRRTRSVADSAPNVLGRAVAERRARGHLYDLTISNPTTAGLVYDADAIARALGTPRSLAYEPDPLGLPEARDVIARDYVEAGIPMSPSRIAVTASTSEAYAILFKMLCDPGDEILVPQPSYPLLGWLSSFEGVVLRSYPLEYAGRWYVDVASLARAVTPRTRAIVVVAPNNPTGSFLGRDELERMLDLDLPIVSDEVFARYPLGVVPRDRVDSALRAERGLVFALSGLSKLAALPQMKLGWIACGGDPARSAEAMSQLEVVLDAYLSVGTPVQHALPELLEASRVTSDAIRARTRNHLALVRAACRGATSVLEVEGGWYATLRVPETRTEEDWAVRLVEEDGVYVHPGYFFDMSRGAHLVVSLLTPEAELAEGMARLVARIDRDL